MLKKDSSEAFKSLQRRKKVALWSWYRNLPELEKERLVKYYFLHNKKLLQNVENASQ